MPLRLIRGRPSDLDALRTAGALIAGLTPDGEWLGVCLADCGFDGALVIEAEETHTVLAGSPAPGAGFVQVMTARVSDRAGWEAADAEAVPRFARARPDFLGSLRLWQGSRLVVIDSYTSLARARAGEAAPEDPQDAAAYARWFSHLSEIEWFDLVELW